MASPSNPVPEQTLAMVLRENEELRASLARIQSAYQATEQRTQPENATDSASEQLRQFLYAASHDLQEPLRAILTYSELIERQLATDSVAREYFSFIVGGANRMKDLLQHMLTYSRAGSAKQRTVMNLKVPLQRALLKMAPDIQACSARIIRHPLPEAIGDEAEIAQVFENVIGNSLKFRSAADPEIIISSEQGTEECTITLRDNGLGIEPRFCRHALLPFKRLHDSHFEGSGLGLAICDKIVRAHHGRIWLESDGSCGATVRFTLPRP
jgi:signal transduction histidine kinase